MQRKWKISIVNIKGRYCHRQSYGGVKCPKCEDMAEYHRYDAAHTPFLIYGYEYHCHGCGCFFEDETELEEQRKYIDALRNNKLFEEAAKVK